MRGQSGMLQPHRIAVKLGRSTACYFKRCATLRLAEDAPKGPRRVRLVRARVAIASSHAPPKAEERSITSTNMRVTLGPRGPVGRLGPTAT
eukprot:scaffold73973_cov65-Phaeocystis_antarctica.AAC.1